MFRTILLLAILLSIISFYSNSIQGKAFARVNSFNEAIDDSTKTIPIANPCAQIQCPLWARVNISQQRLYLYIDGVISDTFNVTTGDKKHATPSMDRHPSGPMFTKYTSKKFPGGNFMGLGNMPYVVFIRGGYAIHGTTPGNFKKLGSRGSHGCIRLHPTNAKIFFDLVKKIGLNNVWVTIEQ